MKILINKEISFEKWNELLTSSPYASPFQTPDFYCLFNTIEGFCADVFAVEIEEKYASLVVVTIQKEKGVKAFFSRRGIIYGGPLIKNEHEHSIEDLFSYLHQFYRKRLIYLEVRNYSDYGRYLTLFQKSNWRYIPWLNFQKDISSEQIAKNTISSSRIRQIKKALKSGVQWRMAIDEDEVKDFYTILQNLYKKKIKKPLFPYSVFKAFFESTLGVFLLVFFEGKVIGGIMCPIMPHKAIYELYVCGLDTEYKDQYPSVMATWAAIEYGLQNKIPLFDFMGAGSPDEHYGVREFKARFGGELVEHGRFLNVLNPLLYNVGKFGLKILSAVKS